MSARLRAGDVMAVMGVMVLVGLGGWQLYRGAWKSDLIALMETRLGASAVALPPPGEWSAADWGEWDFRPVRIEGVFVHEREMYWFAHVSEFGVGRHVLTPMALAGGGHVIVDRGFVPEGLIDPASRQYDRARGRVIVEGVARSGFRRGLFDPPDEPDNNLWFVRDAGAMARAAGVSPAAGVIVEAGAAVNAGGWPRGGQTRVSLPDNHRGYAMTWFALALALGAIYALWRRGRGARAR